MKHLMDFLGASLTALPGFKWMLIAVMESFSISEEHIFFKGAVIS